MQTTYGWHQSNTSAQMLQLQAGLYDRLWGMVKMDIFNYVQNSETECDECGMKITFCKECNRNHHTETFQLDHEECKNG